MYIDKDKKGISILNSEGVRRAFRMVIVDDEDVELENPNFKAEVEAFVGEGFLEANNIDVS